MDAKEFIDRYKSLNAGQRTVLREQLENHEMVDFYASLPDEGKAKLKECMEECGTGEQDENGEEFLKSECDETFNDVKKRLPGHWCNK